MNRSNGLYNIITLLFTLLTIVMCVLLVLLYTKTIRPPRAFNPATAVQATIAVFPSNTPTVTPSLTPIPSDTSQPTSTRVPSKTFTPTSTPSDTPTATFTATATYTASKTPTNTRTPTSTKTPSATIDPSLPTKTPPGFPFKIGENNPAYTANLDASTGCNFQGIGGQVYDMNTQPLFNITINVSSPNGFNQSTTSGSNPRYGPSGWQVQTGANVSNATYLVELRTDKGVPLSPKVSVAFSGICDQNLALINFFQTRPF